jgi:hypothetical protein
MGYSKNKIHKKMADLPKHPKPIYMDNPAHEKSLYGGNVPFKKGPDRERLFMLMTSQGPLRAQEMAAFDVIGLDEYFDQFKLNSLKASITSIKKELAQHERVELGLDGKS